MTRLENDDSVSCPKNHKNGQTSEVTKLMTTTKDGDGMIGDWGQSIVQYGGDDRTGICLCTDTALSACYFANLKQICPQIVLLNRL